MNAPARLANIRTGNNHPREVHFLWILGALAMALLPHSLRFSPLLVASFLALAFWRWAAYRRWLPLPDKQHRRLLLTKTLLVITACVAVWVSYRGQSGRDAGVALLMVLVGLKLLELTTTRDFFIATTLGYFLVVTNFLYSQTIPLAAFMLAVITMLTASMVALYGGRHEREPKWILRRTFFIIVQAIPLAVLAFVFFPRIEGPLWGRPMLSEEAQTGLSDEMTPGSISNLTLSDEIAFRVNFNGRIPPAAERYWRGPVLWHTDGRTWRRGSLRDPTTPQVRFQGEPYRYTITQEPSNKRWLYALELPAQIDDDMYLTRDLQLLGRYRMRRRTSFDLISYPRFTIAELTPAEHQLGLQLPEDAHPRARALAMQWQAQAGGDIERLVRIALSHFNRQPFTYTLAPPLLTEDPVDQFLFETRAGFCEHYASSFVVLMRAAGVPARVVTGYQDGELNPVGDYLIVRQQDAHAWAEVWIEGRGWRRVDPTAAVAPERVSDGLEMMMPARGGLRIINDNPATAALWRRIQQTWDATNHRWNQWVLGFSPARQQMLMRELGLGDIDRSVLAGVMMAAIGATLLLLSLSIQRSSVRERDPVRSAYREFCRRLARIGIQRVPHEGPLDFAARVARLREDLAAPVAEITGSYIDIRYANGNGRDAVAAFRRQVSRFRPRTLAVP
ncbi:MAG: DUF3488 domain-containing transglutaminase family protein [Gammaproteobacteria bacterium]|nr:DUF3488 domain-containing transglutaminase family protein [Gammaproteobacteria bacterium]